MAFNLSKENSKNLRKAITKFNAKVRRLESSDRDLDIPEKESISAIKERVTTKWDLNREINRLERFTKRNAEEMITTEAGLKMSRWELENLQREQRRLSARLLREIQRYEKTKPTEFGEKQFLSYAQMGDDRLNNLIGRYNAISKKNVYKINVDQIKRLEGYLKMTNYNYSRTKKETFYNNFLDGTLLYAGNVIGYDYDKLEYIRSQLGTLTPEQFLRAFNSELSLRYISDKIISPEKGEILRNEEVEEMDRDIRPVLDALYENMDKIISTYKV